MVKNRQFVTVYDVVGLTLVSAALGVGVWTGLVAPGSGNMELGDARSELDRMLRDANSMDAAVRSKESDLKELQHKAESEGALPTRSPVEANLRKITDLADQHSINVRDISPNGQKEYVGVTEVKKAISASGAFPDLVAFLRGFEKADFWADITELKIIHPGNNSADSTPNATVALNVSLFAAPSPENTKVQ